MGSLLAVYRDRHEADAAARDLVERMSVPRESLHVGERADLELSLRAEMDQETSDVIGSPGLGAVMTKEMFRGATLFGLGLGGIGVVVGAALGLVLPGASGWSTGGKVLLGIVIGALFFGTVGTLLGGGLAMKSPEDRLAAERGVPVARRLGVGRRRAGARRPPSDPARRPLGNPADRHAGDRGTGRPGRSGGGVRREFRGSASAGLKGSGSSPSGVGYAPDSGAAPRRVTWPRTVTFPPDWPKVEALRKSRVSWASLRASST